MSDAVSGISKSNRLKLRVAPGNSDDFELWRFGVSPVFEMDAAGREERPRFRLDGVACQFEDFTVSSLTASATRFDRTWRDIARSGIDHFIVVAYLKGGYQLTAAGRETEVMAGDICILDMGRPSWVRTTSYRELSVVLPRSALAKLVPDPDALHGLVLRRGNPANMLLLAHMRALHAQSPNLSREEARAAARAMAELIAACVGPHATVRNMAGEAVAVASLRGLRRRIEANLGDPSLGPDYLIADGSISRSTLYRLFEPFGGVAAYVRQRRLTRAFEMLSDPAATREGIGMVAARCGFASDAAFHRAIRRAYGMSPSDIRAGADERQGTGVGASGGHPFHDVNRWLLGLDAVGTV